MDALLNALDEFLADDSGQGTVEYILIIAMIVIAIMVALAIFRNQIKALINKVTSWLSGEQGKIQAAS